MSLSDDILLEAQEIEYVKVYIDFRSSKNNITV